MAESEVAGLVSIIIPVHNRPRLLEEAVQSVLAQTYRNFEVIIVDDGSTDSTPETIASIGAANTGVVRHLRQENSGPGAAREAGRKVARGEFIQYLDSDDLLLPNKLEVQVAALREHSDSGVAYGRTVYKDSSDRRFVPGWKSVLPNEPAMFPSFIVSRWWETSTPLYRRSVTDAAGAWTRLWLEEDWEYDCRVAALGTRLVFCDLEVAESRDRASQRLSQGTALDKRRLLQRAQAQQLMFDSAMRASLSLDLPEMKNFSRRLFLLSRQCGAAGLPNEAKQLFNLAREAAGEKRSRGRDFRLYRWGAALIGWTLAGRIACWADRFRKDS